MPRTMDTTKKTGRLGVITLLLALALAVLPAPASHAAGPYTVGGTVTVPDGFAPPAGNGSTTTFLEPVGGGTTRYGNFNSATSTWTAQHVPEGVYTIKFSPSPLSGLGDKYYPNAPFPEGAATVVINANRADINFTLEPVLDPGFTWVRILKGASAAGFVRVGDTLTAVPPTLTPAATSSTYQWYIDDVPVGGAMGAEYTLQPDDVGGTVSVAIRAYHAGYTAREFRTSLYYPVELGWFTTSNSTITGTAAYGQTLTVTPGAWTPTPTTFMYQWQRDGVNIAGATNAQYAVKAEDVGTQLAAVVTGKHPGYDDATRSAFVVGIIKPGTFSTVPPTTVTGTARVGEVLTGATGTWLPTPDSFDFQWYRAGTPIAGATTATYLVTPQDRPAYIHLRVTAKKAGYAETSSTSANLWPSPGQLAPGVPTITGTVKAGSVLTARPGTWTPSATFAYEWHRDGVEIAGATKATYTVAPADWGTTLSVLVIGSADGYLDGYATSAGVGVLHEFTKAPKPTIAGTLKAGSTLTAKPGTWAPKPASLTYQWYRGGKAIPGATASTYKVTTADRGTSLAVSVTATRAGYLAASAQSVKVTVPRVFAKSPKPTIVGSGYRGAVVTAKTTGWSPRPSAFTYQWYRAGKAIKGGTSAKYRLVAADAGKKITVKVTAKRAGYTSVSTTSQARALKKFFTKAPKPTVKGTARVGSTLTATRGTWSPKPGSYSYRWYRDGKAIAKATKTSYKLTKADAGKTLTVTVTAKRSGFANTVATSAGKKVATLAFAKAPAPTLKGSAKVGETLTAGRGTWSPKPTSYTYRWYRNGKAIAKATTASYKLTAADAGKTITVKVTGKRAGYTSTTRASKGTAVAKATRK